MQIVEININEIKPYYKNPRKNTKAIHFVEESIKNFGFKVPLTVDKDYVIITDHTRYEACKRLGFKKIPCIIVDDLDEEKIKAFRLADNKLSEIATWDMEKLKEEIENIKDINLELFGFDNSVDDFNWDNIEEISEDLYEEPDLKLYCCPYCNHEDAKWRFKKV